MNDFQDYCCSNLEDQNTLAIEMRKHFTAAATESCFFKFLFGRYYQNNLKMSVKESSSNERLLDTFQEFHPSCKTVTLPNRFSLKHLPITTGNFETYCGQNLEGLFLFMEVRYRISSKKSSQKFIEYFTHSKSEMSKCPKFFFHISKYLDILKPKNCSV